MLGLDSTSMRLPAMTAIRAAATCTKNFGLAGRAYLSSSMPSTTIITAPSNIPCFSVFNGTNSRMAVIKPKKIASPPIRGMGWSCILRPSLGTSTAPTFTDSAFTNGVAARDTAAASPNASNTVQMSWDAMILLRLFNKNSLLFPGVSLFPAYRGRKPTFLYTLRRVLLAMYSAFSAPAR